MCLEGKQTAHCLWQQIRTIFRRYFIRKADRLMRIEKTTGTGEAYIEYVCTEIRSGGGFFQNGSSIRFTENNGPGQLQPEEKNYSDLQCHRVH